MVGAKKHGPTAAATRETTAEAKSRDEVNTRGQTGAHSLASGTVIISVVMGSTCGLTVAPTTARWSTQSWRAMASIYTRMESDIQASFLRIKSMAMAYMSGLSS